MVASNSLFRADELVGRWFSAPLSFANRVRIRTRERFVRDLLHVREGDCLDDEPIAASLRNLRALEFIARAEAAVVAREDSTAELRISVWDAWSTSLGLTASVENGVQLQGLSVAERNLFGRGLKAAVHFYDYRERRDAGADVRAARVFGTDATAHIRGGSTRTGHYGGVGLSQPFRSERSRNFLDAAFWYEDREHGWATGQSNVTRVLLPVADRRAQLTAYRRHGLPGQLSLIGGELSLVHRTVAGPARAVSNGDFDLAPAASASLATELGRQAAPPSAIQVGGSIGSRRIRYVEAVGLDLVHGVQDVATGSDVVATVGRAVGTFNSGPFYSYGWVDAYTGLHRGRWTAVSRLRIGGRHLDSRRSASDRSRWRDIQVDGNGQVTLTIPGVVQQAVVVATTIKSFGHADQFSQTVLSGYGAIRGYENDRLPVARFVLVTLEHRANPPVVHPALGVGTTLFFDAGRGWAGDIPFGMHTGWRAAFGSGLRFGIPARSGANARVELAWPIASGSLGRPIIRTYVVALSGRR